MSTPRKYPFDDRVLGIREEMGALVLSLETKAGGDIFDKVVSRSDLVMGLFATRARLVTSDALGIPLPLYLGQIIAQEWGITRIEYPSYLMSGSMLLPMEVA